MDTITTDLSPHEARRRFREQRHTGPTSGFCPGYAQANLVVIPAHAADAFERYCAANPRPCPLLDRLTPGDPEPRQCAPGADIRTDLPRYRWLQNGGAMREMTDITNVWRDDAVGFLLRCSFGFEAALARVGLVPRHQEEQKNVPMYRTTRVTTPVDPFAAPLVVSMRPVPGGRVEEAYSVTAPFTAAHGAPVHHGDPTALGVGDLARPDWGDAVSIRGDEVPVFWACGVTSQLAVLEALGRGAIAWAITHAPGHMFITDLQAEARKRE